MMTANTHTDHVFALLQTISDPTKAKARLQEIADRDAVAAAKEAELNRREAELSQCEKAHTAKEAAAQKREIDLGREATALLVKKQGHVAAVADFEVKKAAHVSAVAEHVERLKVHAEDVAVLEREKVAVRTARDQLAAAHRQAFDAVTARENAVTQAEAALATKHAKLAAAIA